MMPQHVREILEAVIKRDGYFTTRDIENAEADERQYPRQEARHMINASPDRWKICPICLKNKPLADFLMPTTELRTVILLHREAQQEFAYPCANVAEVCLTCGL